MTRRFARMDAGDESDFIVPPPGMVPEREPEKPIQREVEDDDDVIELPPGLIDSGTFRMPQPPVSRPANTGDAPAFFPVSAHGVTPAAAHRALQMPPPATENPSAAVYQPTIGDAISDAISEETSFAAAPRGVLIWSLTLPDGTHVALDRSTLIGRDPAINPQWPDATLLPVIDPSKSVSKTHAALHLTPAGELIVHDLHSTNGVHLRHPQSEEVVVEPSKAEPVGAAAQLRLGEFVISVARVSTTA
ncbi:FHA domain-containing protein [Salinibacterium sp. NK8237]|nr:FHA domain-containing protein [Salinibacterium sp. NK8237]